MKRFLFTGGALAALAMLAACGQPDETVQAPDGDAVVAVEPGAGDEAPEGDAAQEGADADAAVIDLPADANPMQRNLAMSTQFLEQNAQRDGVEVTDSGLQYEVLTAGADDAASPGLQNWVCVDYTGMLPDGMVFDSTQGAQPIVLPLSGIIDGWREALPMMREGDEWRLFVPPELGYGPSGAGNVIPPNAALVFEIALRRVLETTDLAVQPDGRVDTAWNCAEPAAAGAAD